MNWLVRPIALAALLALVAWAPSAGRASSPPQTLAPARSLTVPFDDLDLSTDRGVRALYDRLGAAARQVCVIETRQSVLDRAGLQADCYREAMAGAVRQLGPGRLAALHAERAIQEPR